MISVESVIENFLFVNNLKIAEKFFCNVLNLSVISQVPDEYVVFNYGKVKLTICILRLDNNLTPLEKFEPSSVTFNISGSHISSWRKHLDQHGVKIEKEIYWPTGAYSILFRDPSNNLIQLIANKNNKTEKLTGASYQKNFSPNGMPAEWKLFHAAKQGAEDD